jgi:predicted GIY-YIG superfamily endonuclease
MADKLYSGIPGVIWPHEKAIKKWNRVWKLRLIEEANPEWRDLAEYSLW